MTEPNWLFAALSELKSIATECGKENWDGLGARPISKETIGFASEFVRCLYRSRKTYDIRPNITSETDGDICIHWGINDPTSISLSVNNQGVANFAAHDGDTTRIHGNLWIDPPNIEKSVAAFLKIFDFIF